MLSYINTNGCVRVRVCVFSFFNNSSKMKLCSQEVMLHRFHFLLQNIGD